MLRNNCGRFYAPAISAWAGLNGGRTERHPLFHGARSFPLPRYCHLRPIPGPKRARRTTRKGHDRSKERPGLWDALTRRKTPDKVAREMGNSAGIVLKHYHEIVEAKAARE